jgi:hypothetical protein
VTIAQVLIALRDSGLVTKDESTGILEGIRCGNRDMGPPATLNHHYISYRQGPGEIRWDSILLLPTARRYTHAKAVDNLWVFPDLHRTGELNNRVG